MDEAAALPLTARLHHICLGSPDPAALGDFYARVMGLRLDRAGELLIGRARDRRVLFAPGPATSLAFAGFATDRANLGALAARLEARAWPYMIRADGTDLFTPGALSLADPDGNMLIFGVPREEPDGLPEGLKARLQHVVVASRDAARMADFYQSALGFRLSDNVLDEERTVKTSFLRCSEEHHSFAVFQAPKDRFDHHCYEAGDWGLIRDWGDHFASHHVPVQWGPGRHGPGNNLFLFVHDPDGNWLEISAELEVVTPDRPAGEWRHEERTLNSWGSAPLRG